MIKRYLAKIFKKKLYKAEIIIVEDDFIAEHYADTLSACLSWTLVGLQEARSTATKSKLSHTKGIYGRLMPLKVISVTQKSIGFMSYKKPVVEDYLFMTDSMVHVPDSIMKVVRKEEPDLIAKLK
tara:strand:- start:27832 stop:28206 length:375 start_codon:yes stop_codon:yes gene_type:complete